MEIIFVILGMLALCVMQYFLHKEMKVVVASQQVLQKNFEEMDSSLAGDIEGVEKALVLLSQKTDALPDTFKDDLNRFLLSFRETLEATKPIKPNNWDSFREAFKGPTRVEINERN